MIKRMTVSLLALALALCFTPATARAEKLTKEEKDLIKDTMRNLEMGAQSGRLARKQTKNDRVQTFAEKVTSLDADMIGELHEFANKHDFTFDGDPTKPDVRTKKELEDSKGSDFDRRYMSMAVHEHEEMLELFKKGASEAKNDDLQKWYRKHQDAVKQHLDDARVIYGEVNDKLDKQDRDQDKKDKKHRN